MARMSDNSCNRIKRGETRERESGERVSAGEDSMPSADGWAACPWDQQKNKASMPG